DPNGWRQEPYSGGLGWSLPAAMGQQLADRERLIVSTMGDGSYMFANPTVCHQVAEALELPVITMILNNREWGAVRHSVKGMYPDGYASRANQMPLTALQPTPDFTLTAQASRAHTERVEHGEDLPAALDRAIDVALGERRQVLMDIANDGSPGH
ncbi:MAG: thiamine pyrophosphate-dependent enzyme, partial [Pseudomonadota bacterium]